jgi:hypothetical protein
MVIFRDATGVLSGCWFTSKLVSGNGDEVLRRNNQIWYNKQSYLTYEYMSMTWVGRLRQVCGLEV